MTAKTMADVLAEHQWYDATTDNEDPATGCTGCDDWFGSEDALDDGTFAAHQAGALSAAGFGLVTDAKAELSELTRLAPRFWNKVDIREDTACWQFQGSTDDFGYGSYKSPAGSTAHRYAWALANTAAPASGEVVRHRCDNPSCCNPKHLEIGTQLDNVADMIGRGRAPYKKDHCRKGHELTPDNIVLKGNDRRCRKCYVEYGKERRRTKPNVSCPECGAVVQHDNLGRHRNALHGVPRLRARAAALRGDS